MFIYFLWLGLLANGCEKACTRPCFYLENPERCLQDCGCPSDPQLYVWNCSWAFISACKYSVNFTVCMYENDCGLELPQKGRALNEGEVASFEGGEQLVECSDCKIFEGDDYWECVSEYCADMTIELTRLSEGCYDECAKNCADCEEECQNKCKRQSEDSTIWYFAIGCSLGVVGLYLLSKQPNRGYLLIRE